MPMSKNQLQALVSNASQKTGELLIISAILDALKPECFIGEVHPADTKTGKDK